MAFLISCLLLLGYTLGVVSFLIVRLQKFVFSRWKIQGLVLCVALEVFGSVIVYHLSDIIFTTTIPEEQGGNLSGLNGVFDWLFSSILILALSILNISNIVSAIAMIREDIET